MECLPHPTDEAEPAKAREPGRLQRWVRAALFGTLTVVCGGDARPSDHHHGNAKDNAALQNAVPPRLDGLPGTFTEERMKDPSLTEEQYLYLLAQKLSTSETIHTFFTTRMRSTPRSHENGRTSGGHLSARTAVETLRRMENGKMLGNCADYAFLAQEILQRQGRAAHVLAPPGHAVCVWIEERTDGKYDGFGLDDLGVNKNGETSYASRRGVGREEPSTPDGYTTMIEAVNAVLQHYEDDSSDDMSYDVHPYHIPILRIHLGFHYDDIVTIHAFDPDGSLMHKLSGIDVAIFTLLVGGPAAYILYRRRRGKGSLKEYLTKFRLY